VSDPYAELRAAWLELRATVLATLTTPHALAQIIAIGVVVMLGVWFVTELVRSLT
jgi:uncharacterized membrane protein